MLERNREKKFLWRFIFAIVVVCVLFFIVFLIGGALTSNFFNFSRGEKEEASNLNLVECEIELFDFNPGKTGVVSITFDDGFKSVIGNAFPLMEEYGYRGTNYVMPKFIGKDDHMTWEDLAVLHNNCWETGSHTMNHPDLTELSREDVYYEVGESKKILEEKGFTVKGLATPYGEYNEKVLEIVEESYYYHRTAWPNGLNDIPFSSSERYELRVVGDHEGISVEEIKEWIFRAKEEKKWIILLFHRVGESGEYNTSMGDFEEILRVVDEEGIPCLPVSTVFYYFLRE